MREGDNRSTSSRRAYQNTSQKSNLKNEWVNMAVSEVTDLFRIWTSGFQMFSLKTQRKVFQQLNGLPFFFSFLVSPFWS